VSPPSRLWYVEWYAARRYDKPLDRKRNRRTYLSGEYASRQYTNLVPWIGTHIEVVGAWVSTGCDDEGGIEWSRFYGPAVLPITVTPAWDDEIPHQEEQS